MRWNLTLGIFVNVFVVCLCACTEFSFEFLMASSSYRKPIRQYRPTHSRTSLSMDVSVSMFQQNNE